MMRGTAGSEVTVWRVDCIVSCVDYSMSCVDCTVSCADSVSSFIDCSMSCADCMLALRKVGLLCQQRYE